jgi:hypothetical protein
MGAGSPFVGSTTGVSPTGDVFKLSPAAFDLTVAGAWLDKLL